MHDQTLWPRGGSTVHLTIVRLFSLFLFARGNAQESKLENEFLFTPRINRNRRKTGRSSTVKPRSFKFPTYPAKLVAPHFLANFRRNVSVSHDTFSRYITYIKVPYVKNFVVIKSRLSRFSLSLSLWNPLSGRNVEYLEQWIRKKTFEKSAIFTRGCGKDSIFWRSSKLSSFVSPIVDSWKSFWKKKKKK